MLLFGCEMCPYFQVCPNTWSLAAGIFRKIAKSLDGGALLEEMGRCGWDLRLPTPRPLPVCSLVPDCTGHVTSCLRLPAPSARWTVSPRTESQDKTFHPYLAFVLYLCPSNERSRIGELPTAGRNPLWETVWGVFRKIRSKIPYGPTAQLLCLYAKENSQIWRRSFNSRALYIQQARSTNNLRVC